MEKLSPVNDIAEKLLAFQQCLARDEFWRNGIRWARRVLARIQDETEGDNDFQSYFYMSTESDLLSKKKKKVIQNQIDDFRQYIDLLDQ